MKQLILAVAIILLISNPVLAVDTSVSQQKEKKSSDVGITAAPNPVPGEIFTGDYLRVGINNAGTLGVGQNDPGVGFQWAGDIPFQFPSTESTAIWWWGEGYKIAYKEREKKMWVDTVAYYQPGFGYPPPPETNIIPVSEKLLINDNQKAVKEIKVMTKDKKLLITFIFTFLKQYPELNLETTITNIGRVPLRDVVYTRIIDWDVCTNTSNTWASTGHEAYAWGPCEALNDEKVQLTIAGHDGDMGRDGDYKKFGSYDRADLLGLRLPIVNYVDLSAWDDDTIRSPNFVVQSFSPIPLVDYNAGIYYKILELKPKESKTVYTVYQSNFPRVNAGDSSLDAAKIEETAESNE